MAVTIQISEAFVVNHPVVGGILGHKEVTTSCTRFHAASSSENENDQANGGGEGGTEWIKNAMGTNANNDNVSSSNTPPPPPSAPYTEDEIKTMENLILELSLEKDDTIRRAKLSAIFDKVFELDEDAATTTSSSTTNTVDGGDAVSSSDGSSIEGEREAPRFAQLFQYSLDNVGELVQCAAREKAELLNNSSSNDDNGSSSRTEEADAKQQEERSTSTTEGRVKSEEELQLWALIDMMVQSKTMVKMYMGSLGSKGVFR